MFKKAGIIVGITIILLAIGIYWFVGYLDKEKDDAEGIQDPSASVVTDETLNGVQEEEPTSESSEPTQSEVETPPDQSNQPIQQGEENTSNQTEDSIINSPSQSIVQNNQPNTVFSEIDEQTLGNPIISRTEVLVISKKKLIVLDSKYGTNEGKQLAYSIELLSGDKTMTMFLNGSAYDTLTVGDKLKVDYEIYMNDKGVEFPVILNAVTVQ